MIVNGSIFSTQISPPTHYNVTKSLQLDIEVRFLNVSR